MEKEVVVRGARPGGGGGGRELAAGCEGAGGGWRCAPGKDSLPPRLSRSRDAGAPLWAQAEHRNTWFCLSMCRKTFARRSSQPLLVAPLPQKGGLPTALTHTPARRRLGAASAADVKPHWRLTLYGQSLRNFSLDRLVAAGLGDVSHHHRATVHIALKGVGGRHPPLVCIHL